MCLPNICGYCLLEIQNDNYLDCTLCFKSMHLNCLKTKSTPGDFVDDIFFKFKCVNCNHEEEFIREKLSWTLILILTLKHLTVKSQGLSYYGYFHWRTHIANFIEKNWTLLISADSKRKKNWIGTVTGTLSFNSPDIFKSGSCLVKGSGWWKLAHNIGIRRYVEIYKERLTRKKNTQRRKLALMQSADANNKQISPINMNRSLDGQSVSFASTSKSETITGANELDYDLTYDSEDDSLDNTVARVIKVTNFQEIDHDHQYPTDLDVSTNEQNGISVCDEQESVEPVQQIETPYVKQEKPDDDILREDKNSDYPFVAEPSLFTVTLKRPLPWENGGDDSDEDKELTAKYRKNNKNLKLISVYQENETYNKLKKILDLPENQNADNPNIPKWIRRFYRKLAIRQEKRDLNLPLFDLEKFGMKNPVLEAKQKFLDRYHQKTNKTLPHISLVASTEYTMFQSPTGRVLHPFIYRDKVTIPPHLKLMIEIYHLVNDKLPSRSTIDYCYLRPHHIAGVNGLLQNLFWPGIDMSECLSYPDYSIVALYKKLVIGCAFLVPDAGHNEAHISFMAVRPGWQHCEIGAFMLYILIQTCIFKDLTLHVSATNPAIFLYQKWGFKIQEKIIDFYDKYLPINSRLSRTAFFLRRKALEF